MVCDVNIRKSKNIFDDRTIGYKSIAIVFTNAMLPFILKTNTLNQHLTKTISMW